MNRASIATGLLLLVGSAAAPCQQPPCSGPQLGTWKLVSVTFQYEDTGEKTQPYGAHPSGYLSYGADCRMNALIVSDGRKPPAGDVPTGAEKAGLYDGLVAYAGTWSIAGDKVSHHVDISWNQAWTGTTQVRQFRIEGDRLHIRSMPAKSFQDGRVVSAILEWIRVPAH
jgi:lipocalin-like protein